MDPEAEQTRDRGRSEIPRTTTAAQTREAIWTAESELNNLHRKKGEDRKTRRVMAGVCFFAMFFFFLVTAINSGTPLAYLGGAGFLFSGIFFGLNFLPNRRLNEQIAGVEGRLYILKNRWSRQVLENGH